MITASADLLAVLGGPSWIYRVRLESWLAGELLDDDVPVTSGQLICDQGLNVPERLELQVPRRRGGVSYVPIDERAPLAANGQRLRLMLGVDTGRGITTWIQRGWFLVQDSPTQGDSISVAAVGLLQLVQEARLVSPYQPSGTFQAAVRGLVEPALTVDFTNAPTNRSVPSGVNFDDDRLAGLYEILDAWPARARVNTAGVLEILAPLTIGAADREVSDQINVIRAVGSSTRDGVYNAVVARGTASDGTQVQGAAYDQSAGPHRYGGPFNPLPVPYFMQSPLITTVAQANAAAQTSLDRILREVSPGYELEMIIAPLTELSDVWELTTTELGTVTGTVEKFTLPITPTGAMSATVREVI